MQSYETLFSTKQPLSNIRFMSSDKLGANLFFVPESTGGLQKFLNSQIKSYYQQITIPGIISNFLGKKLSNPKYYLAIKKELPSFIYNHTPGKQLREETSNIFDFSGIINDIMSTSKSRSAKQVFDEFNKLITSIIKDYPSNRSNILLIQGDSNLNVETSDFLNFLDYIQKLHSAKIQSDLDGIIYLLDGKYFPLAIPVTIEGIKYLQFQRNILNTIIKNKTNISTGISTKIDITDIDINKEEVATSALTTAREKIEKLSKNKESIHESMKEIKKIVHELKDISGEKLVGTFKEKLEILYKDDTVAHKELTKLNSEINKKYNGNVTVNINESSSVFNMQQIVGMDELGGYNKQNEELTHNMDDLIEDLVHGTLESDPELPINIKKISSKIVDNYKDRYKEYTVRIQHSNIGESSNSPYNISFRIPIPVQEKYIKIGGNNFILINQLFPKPIQKVAPNLVRFYTHYSTASLSIKNTKLTASNSFIDIEDKFVQSLKSTGSITLENFDNATKDDLVMKYGLEDLSDFKYSKMKIKA